MNGIATISSVIADSLIPPSLQPMCNTSLKVIQDASSNQILGAVEHNQDEINRLLVQLLTITFISQNKSQIEKELCTYNSNDHVKDDQTKREKNGWQINTINKSKSKNQNKNNENNMNDKQTTVKQITNSSNNNIEFNMRQYCESTLLKLSPILGFTRIK